jgi:hypothetical protein
LEKRKVLRYLWQFSQAIDLPTFSRLLPMDNIKAQIQELISLGKTEEALELLEQLTNDAILLQSRFNGAKKQYGMGLIDFSEWSRIQAQINYAALEMMNSVKDPKKGKGTATAGVDVSNSSNVIAGVGAIHVGGNLIIGGGSSTGTGATQDGNTTQPLQILMLTANPAGTTKLNLDKEYARISEELQHRRDQLNLTVRRAVDRSEFKQFTETLKPAILHFSGHGEQGGEHGGIILQNEDKNDYEMISPEKLDSLFKYFKRKFTIKAVVLNACFSQEQAAAIAPHVPYVIGTTTELVDEYAISFSTGFYFNLANSNLNFEDAFESGRMEAVLAGAKDENFVLYKDAQVLDI